MIIRGAAASACAALVFLLFGSAAAFAQSGIAGVVKDTSGGVMPGVTVDAASPALIEKVRTAVTDSEGRYRLDDLRPGAYTVTFGLPGFTTVKREGIQLPTAFTATVNVEMRVGDVSESITVTGEAPTVDIHSVTTQNVFSQKVVEALPSLRSAHQFARLAPAVTSVQLQDASSSNKDQFNIAAYGGRIGETIPMIDGVTTTNRVGGGSGGTNMRLTSSYVQEVHVVLAGGTAEQAFGGVVMNVIPKEGGNTFAVGSYIDYAPGTLQSDNLTDELRAKGAPSINKTLRQYDFNPYGGGPIAKNKIWVFAGYRNALINQTVAGTYADTNVRDWVYTPDLSRPAENKTTDFSYNARLTWQISRFNKVSVFGEHQPHVNYNRHIEFGHAPEGATYTPYSPNGIFAVTWKMPISSQMLLENRGSFASTRYIPGPVPTVAPNAVSALISETGMVIRANSSLGSGAVPYGDNTFRHTQYSSSLSYVTGTHSFRTGVQLGWPSTFSTTSANQDIAVSLRNAVPVQLTQYATPYLLTSLLRTAGVFVQDQWAIKRLTLNLGLRYDYLEGHTPDETYPAVRFSPVRNFTAEKNVPNYKDLSPRLGAAYDLFGDSRTALKASLSRYVNVSGLQRQQTFVASATRALNMTGLTWTDAEGNFFPNCDLMNPLANGACGPISNRNFGLQVPNSTTADDDVLRGFGVRLYNWETAVGIQRELARGLSVSADYHRRWYGNFRVTQNLATTPSDYDPYCITTPADPRLPNGGGYQVCGLTNVSVAKFGRVQNRIRMSDNFGRQFEHYNGVDISFTARLPRDILFAGGLNNGRSETNSCFVVNSAQDLFNCDVRPPFQTNVKLYGVVPLGWGVQLSPVYQRVPAAYGQYVTGGITNYAATYLATNAQIAPSLGRNLSSGAAGTVNIVIVPPGEVLTEDAQQLDLRLSKRFQAGRARIMTSIDINNVTNGSSIQRANTNFGPSYLQPQVIQPSRWVKLNAQIDF